jgi:hypothetical protein
MKLTAIVDSVGRVILGRESADDSNDQQLALKNPAVVNIQVNQQSGQISVQLIPFIFREFIQPAEENEPPAVTWKFQRSAIVVSDDVNLAENIEEQYTKIFEMALSEAEIINPETGDPETEKLFDEDEASSDDKS